jgi:hypothetical protein
MQSLIFDSNNIAADERLSKHAHEDATPRQRFRERDGALTLPGAKDKVRVAYAGWLGLQSIILFRGKRRSL